jgi:hypothetical protein
MHAVGLFDRRIAGDTGSKEPVMRIVCPILALLAFALGPSRTTADELLARHLPFEEVVDSYIDARIKS